VNEANPPPGDGNPPKRNWLRRNLTSILMFAAVAAITVVLVALNKQIEHFQDLGYLGAFIISIVGNATVVLPMPAVLLIIPIAAALNPLLVGLVAGVGGAMGEMTAYFAGYSGRGIWKDNKAYLRAVAWLKKWGIWIVFLFAVTPLPADVMGIAAGNLRFPAWKYFVAVLPGKIIKYMVLVYTGKWGWEKLAQGGTARDCMIAVAAAGIATAAMVLSGLQIEEWAWRRSRGPN
jgi:membrane protein YqaA with SNARE-associated domain